MKVKQCKTHVFTMLCICIVVFFCHPSQVDGSKGIEHKLIMDVCVNFDQQIKYDRYANVLVELENQDEQEFKGFLQAVCVVDEGPLDCIYQTAIAIRRNTKQNMNIALPIEERVKKVLFRIVAQDGKTISQVEEQLKIEKENDTFYLGVLGDGKEYLKNLEGMRLKPIEIPEYEIPEVEEGLDNFDAILISNQYLEESSLERISVIRSWCKAGGTVMIGRMDLAAKNFFGISYKPSQVVKNQDGEKLYQIYEMEEGILFEWIHSPDFLKDIRNESEYVEKAFYDIINYYSRGIRQRKYSEMNNGKSAEKQMIRSLEGGGEQYLPKGTMYGFLIILYAFTVGPVLYFILNRRRKNMLYYIGVPIVSGVFSLAIWLVGTNTRICEPILNTITVYKYDGHSGRVKERSYTSINVPADKKERITVEKKNNIKLDNPAVNTSDEGKYQVVIDQRTNNSRIELIEPLYMKSYVVESTTRKRCTGSISYDLEFDGKDVKGKITNNLGLELQDAVLISNYHVMKLGSLPDGGEMTITNKQEVFSRSNFSMGTETLVKKIFHDQSKQNCDNVVAMRKHAAFIYALKNECFDFGNESYVIGYIKGNAGENYETTTRNNISLVVYSLRDVKASYNRKKLIVDIDTFKETVSGHVSIESRIMNTESVVVTYQFPSGMKIDSLLYLDVLNAIDENNKMFLGDVSVRNNDTMKYDTIFQGGPIMNLKKGKYISDGNKIVIKYTSYSELQNRTIESLPVISAIEEVE